MELFVYTGIGQLASLDFDCLRTLAFVKFNEIPVKISFNGSPSNSPNGFLPYLKDETSSIAGYDEIVTYFQSKGFGTDEYLSLSYVNHIESKLLPYVKYILWGEPNNVDAVRSLYAKRINFPFNFVYPHKYIKQTHDLLQLVASFSIEDKIQNHNTAELILNAKSFVNMLAERYEKRLWFLGGRKPNEVDATIFAALSILINFPLQNNDLKSHINECPSLVKFIARIQSKYLSDIQSPEQAPTITNRMQKLFVNKEKGTLSNGVIKILFGVFTISSMVFFAISNGILEIDTDDTDDSQDYIDDE